MKLISNHFMVPFLFQAQCGKLGARHVWYHLEFQGHSFRVKAKQGEGSRIILTSSSFVPVKLANA